MDDSTAERELKRAAPPPEDLRAKLARASVEGRLFGKQSTPVEIGRYVLREELGTGGMGVVYRAYDPQLQRDVALKLLHAGVHDAERAQSRLVAEARAMARLDHPNVLTVHEVGTFEDQVFVAMEYVEGSTLTQWLRTDPPPAANRMLDVFIQAGRALAAAHEAGIVHRDFKPDNVMVSARDRVRVLDFGLARRPEGAGPSPSSSLSRGSVSDLRLTRSGTLMGTPAYMAPEQHAGETTDARSDQFSYCVALWEAAFGERPFRGSDITELGQAVRAGRIVEPPSLGELPWLRRLLERGLCVDPEQRFADMFELVEAIEAARRPRARGRWLSAVAIASGLVLGGWGLLAGLRSSSPSASPQRDSGPPGRALSATVPPGESEASDPVPDATAPAPSDTAESPFPKPPGLAPDPDMLAENTGREPPDPPLESEPVSAPRFERTWCYHEEDVLRRIDVPRLERRTRPTLEFQLGESCYACRRVARRLSQSMRRRTGRPECAHFVKCQISECEG